jgi:hypothetical protein
MILILKYRKKINEFCEMSEPVFETSHGNPQIVWAIFLDE